MNNKSIGYVMVALLFAVASGITMAKVDGDGGGLVAIAMIAYAGFALYQASKS